MVYHKLWKLKKEQGKASQTEFGFYAQAPQCSMLKNWLQTFKTLF